MSIIHKEGYASIIITLLASVVLCFTTYLYLPYGAFLATASLCLLLLIIVLQFFRNPKRSIKTTSNSTIYAPADGKVVVIEETEEGEYFKERRIQMSIFMSPLNVHVNRNPISGKVNYYKYHPGRYLVAWHPKSSTENERSTVVLDNGKHELLIRQIAGALARRIVNYSEVGKMVEQGSDMGFIKFGSRVDVFLPLGADIKVKIGDTVRGNKSILAELPS